MLTPQLAFIAPQRLLILLVIPLLILAYIFASRRKNRRGMRFTNTSMLDVVVPGSRSGGGIWRWPSRCSA